MTGDRPREHRADTLHRVTGAHPCVTIDRFAVPGPPAGEA